MAKFSEKTRLTNMVASYLLPVVKNPDTDPELVTISSNNFFGNINSRAKFNKTSEFVANTTFTANVSISGDLVVRNETPGSNDAVSEGYGLNSFWIDDNYLYVTISTGDIRRVPLEVF